MKLEMADGRHEDTAQDPKPEPPPTSTVQADLRRVPGRGRGRCPLSTILRASLAFGDGRLSPAGARQWSAKGQNAPGPNAKNAKRALPAARRCCKKPLQVGRKPVSAPKPSLEGDVPDRDPKTKFLSLFLDEVWCGERLLVL
jgi:hypothetical protein